MSEFRLADAIAMVAERAGIAQKNGARSARGFIGNQPFTIAETSSGVRVSSPLIDFNESAAGNSSDFNRILTVLKTTEVTPA